MKKILLSMAAVIFAVSLNAQTHSDLAGNAPTELGRGYVFNFSGTSDNNCFAGGGVANWAMPANQTWSIENDSLKIVGNAEASFSGAEQINQLYSGDCAATTIDLSNTANQKVSLSFTATVAGNMAVTFHGGGQSNYNETPNTFAFTVGANTYAAVVDLTGITDKTAIAEIGLVPRSTDISTYEGTIKIDNIRIGDAVVLASTRNAIVDNSLISVYPNPAKDMATVDLSAIMGGGSREVKVINAYGEVMLESVANSDKHDISLSNLQKGMYVVQVTSGNKVSSKKLIVQ